MAKKKDTTSNDEVNLRPMRNQEARQARAINLAFDAAEKQLLDGTASSQVITHFLKLATVEAQLEKEKLEEENKLLRAKTKALENGEKREELYAQVLAAMKKYTGHGSDPEPEPEDDYDDY